MLDQIKKAKITGVKKNTYLYRWRASFNRTVSVDECTIYDDNLRVIYTINNRHYIIPFKTELMEIIKVCHGDYVHLNDLNTVNSIKALGFNWYSIWTDIRKYIKECINCLKVSAKCNLKALRPITGYGPKELLVIDTMEIDYQIRSKIYGHPPYLLNAVDHFSKFAFSSLIGNKEAQTITNCLSKFFVVFVPSRILSDNGKEFGNRILAEYLAKAGSNQIFGRPRHPQTQGAVEAFNRFVHLQLVRNVMDLSDHYQQVMLVLSSLKYC